MKKQLIHSRFSHSVYGIFVLVALVAGSVSGQAQVLYEIVHIGDEQVSGYCVFGHDTVSVQVLREVQQGDNGVCHSGL